jgi:hypothetical protein
VHSLEIIIYVVMKMHGKHSMKLVFNRLIPAGSFVFMQEKPKNIQFLLYLISWSSLKFNMKQFWLKSGKNDGQFT